MATRTKRSSQPDGVCPKCNRAFDDHGGMNTDKFPEGVTCPEK